MPFMQLKTNVAVTEQQETLLKTSFGSAITAIPGKSETWLMVGIEPQYTLYFQGSDAPAAMVEVSIFGSASDAAYADFLPPIPQKFTAVPTAHRFVPIQPDDMPDG